MCRGQQENTVYVAPPEALAVAEGQANNENSAADLEGETSDGEAVGNGCSSEPPDAPDNKHDEAEEAKLWAALEREPENEIVLNDLATLLWNRGQHEEAQKLFARMG